MRLVPLNDKIVVKRDEAEGRSKGGIVLPDNAKQKPQRGKVLAVGDGKLLDNGTRVPVACKEGDTVVFTAWTGNEVEIEGEKYVIMPESDILGVLSE